jgi:phage tail-like protein
MPRLQVSDPLQGFRFHVSAVEGGYDPIGYKDADAGEAGFQSVTVPEVSAEVSEYREGTMMYTRKYSGIPTFAAITLIRGVYMRDTSFYDWILDAIEGREYVTDLVIYHWHRVGKDPDKTSDATKARQYIIRDAVPSRVKPAADLDSTSSEVSLAEVDVEYTSFDLKTAELSA